jgi:hypothetical protein
LAKRSFSRTNFPWDNHALGHAVREFEEEAEELHEEAEFLFSVRQPARYVVNIQLRFVPKQAMVYLHA